jgi:hypothetical protein
MGQTKQRRAVPEDKALLAIQLLLEGTKVENRAARLKGGDQDVYRTAGARAAVQSAAIGWRHLGQFRCHAISLATQC